MATRVKRPNISCPLHCVTVEALLRFFSVFTRLASENLADKHVHPIDVPQADLSYLTWTDAANLLVVAATADANQPWMLPAARTLKRVRAADGTLEDVK